MIQFSTLEYIGVASISILTICAVKRLFDFVYTYFIGPKINKVDYRSKGKWALITGCTDGIGKEYARQLAARGCDIILISRSLAKLQATAEEIEKEFKVSTKIIQVDFNGGNDIYDKISHEISGYEIGTLVNNVGVAYSYPEYFLDVPDWKNTMSMIVKANMVSMIEMTYLVLPQMVKRGKGVIINVGSAASLMPCPMLAVYAASKAFVKKFTEDLVIEYAGNEIIIQCTMPGVVVTKMSWDSKRSLTSPTPKTYVKSALALVGTASLTTGYLPHKMVTNVVNFIFNISSSLGSAFLIRGMKEIRKNEINKNNEN